VRLPDGSGVSREAPAPFCERLTWKFRGSTHHEILNVMKNHGYCIDRNYGHGKKNLAFNFYLLTLLAFSLKQIL